MLPSVNTVDQYRVINLRDNCFVEAARSVFAGLNNQVNTIALPSNGSLPVVFVNETAIKFFPALYAEESEREIKALKFLSAHDVPKLLDAGEIQGWQYVMMSKLAGHSLKDLWPRLSNEDRKLACFEVGKRLRKIHELTLPESDTNFRAWTSFLSAQKVKCFERHEELGLKKDLLNQIPAFIESVELSCSRLSFLHTEVMRDHVFFETRNGQISFSGFIDFEPSMVGAFEYDFGAVGIFLSSGERYALRAFFEGYGNLDQASSREFRRRIMAYSLLHKYSNLKWYLEFLPNADSLDALADLWWGI